MVIASKQQMNTASLETILGQSVDDDRDMQALAQGLQEVSLPELSKLLDHLPMMVCYLDRKLRFQYVNRNYRKVTGYKAVDLLGKSLKSILNQVEYEEAKSYLRKVFKGQCFQRIETKSYANGETYLMDAFYLPTQDVDGKVTGYFAIKRVLESEAGVSAEFKPNNSYDGLTGLKNRNALHRDLQDMMSSPRASKQMCLIQLNLCRFSEINKSLGHHVGDQVLQHMATKLTAHAGHQANVYRLGGDEFALLYPYVPEGESYLGQLAESILQVIKEAFRTSGFKIRLSARMGIVQGVNKSRNSSDLLRNAEIAYAHAVNEEKSYEVYAASMRKAIIQKLKMESELQLALRGGQIIPWYQPLVDARTKRIVGYEALARWIRPDGQQISPGKFIPVAEQSGLITELGDRILLRAIRTVQMFQSQIPQTSTPVYVSVNVSPVQLMSTGYLDRLKEIMAATDLDPRQLLLEVTEEIASDHHHSMLDIVREMKSMGLRIACDDFGAGYSSLARLRDMPWDCLKIDRSFLLQDENVPLLSPMCQMANQVGMPVIIEGVETQAHHEKIQSLGCEFAQGYFYGKPNASMQPGELIV